MGALRENTALLAAYAIFLAILLLLEMTCGILGFIFKDWIKAQASSGFQAFIVHYRDDPDQQNLIDWIQEGWLQCCGIEGPKVGNLLCCNTSDQWINAGLEHEHIFQLFKRGGGLSRGLWSALQLL